MTDHADPIVRHFRQILLWPVQLMPIRQDSQIQNHWEVLEGAGEDNAWRELTDEFTGDPAQFQERHYSEFVTFLPYVQRFLYGEGKGRGTKASESPIRVFRRNDVTRVRLTPPGDPAEPMVFDVAHVDLYFFYDIDVVILAVEIFSRDLPLSRAQEVLYRFGRAYPTFWNEDGGGGHCLARVEWLSEAGDVLATSDFEKRDKFLRTVASYRAPAIAAHWEFLLKPLVSHHSDERGVIRYRQIERHRMPVLGYLALDEPRRLSRGDFMRLALVTAPGPMTALPMSERHARDFEYQYCYDRYWLDETDGPCGVRYMCSGHAFIMVGGVGDPFYVDSNKGLLGQFRHQYFLLFLIPHFHKAALLMLADRQVDALNRLDIFDAESVKRFKRAIRRLKEVFLRFTHRYWFLEVSDQAQAAELFRMCSEHLGAARLYDEVRDEIQDMSEYLDSDSLRRQANTVVRLTVVTAFGLIGTVTTGFLGMNLIAEAENPLWVKIAYFMVVFVATVWLTAYTIVKSKRLSDFLEALSDDRLPTVAKLGALVDVWRNKR
ncbi:MAG TPA: CorA family divalent cation transporter [Vineibacter sp.]|nr:CorA family divalent cation transporter [Vineibacter sp.]